MKRIFVVSLALLMISSALAFAGPSVNPWFEISSEGIVDGFYIDAPSLESGITIAGMISSAWFVDLGVTYDDEDLLDADNVYYVGFEANVGFDQFATVNTTGGLLYGCSLSLTSDTGFTPGNAQDNYPTGMTLYSNTVGFMLEGYVGPLTLWGGVEMPWDRTINTGGFVISYTPIFGIRVDFDIPL